MEKKKRMKGSLRGFYIFIDPCGVVLGCGKNPRPNKKNLKSVRERNRELQKANDS